MNVTSLIEIADHLVNSIYDKYDNLQETTIEIENLRNKRKHICKSISRDCLYLKSIIEDDLFANSVTDKDLEKYKWLIEFIDNLKKFYKTKDS